MATNLETEVRAQLKKLLDGGEAHAKLDAALENMPFASQGTVPQGLPYSAWQIAEHIRIAQRDILDFSRNGSPAGSGYKAMKWPDDYWPKSAEPPAKTSWSECAKAIRSDRAEFEALLADDDLMEPFAWGEGQTLLREALLIADHEAYHTGELIVVRRLLGAWKPKEGHA